MIKKNPVIHQAIAILAILIVCLSSCIKNNAVTPPLCLDTQTCFDLSKLDAQLKMRLDSNCIGYGYEISN